ncbi:MAG: hypothetical protein AMJ95_02395 [Omnitrophica WOR_2 bacterium SM23_72]|nr:MAG: hypothetical protein AMJ95_02395 [Omnitrophica WOR_2 bacterium SM23_72]
MENPLQVVVTGDVDSGKSTLIGRFLYEAGALSQEATEEITDICQRLKHDFEFAYLLDSLEEERVHQLTMDTTQAFCKTKKGRGFVFIDVPGHQELIKNMLCGSSYADMAILVVDINKSVEQQTKRHAFILRFLGIEHIIVVLNKMDLVSFDEFIFKKVKQEVSVFFQKLQIKPKYFIPLSANQGENLLKISKNMAWYKGVTLIEAINTYFRNKEKRALRLPVQDIYDIDKEKVAVGKIMSGRMRKGEEVDILPLNKKSRIKRIRVFNRNRYSAYAPESIGLILDDMANLGRGQIICRPKLPRIVKNIVAKIFCVQALNTNKSLTFKSSTQKTIAQISQIMGVWDIVSLEPKSRQGKLEKNDVAKVAINAEKPVAVESFEGFNSLGRFVLEKDTEICAIGMIC